MDMNAFSLKGKIAWITGASYGIGFAIAEAYAAAGARIVFNDINQELVDKGLKAYAEKGIDAEREYITARYREVWELFRKYGLPIYGYINKESYAPETFDPDTDPRVWTVD